MLFYCKFVKLSIVWNNYVIEGMHNQDSSIPFKSNSNHKIKRNRQRYFNYLYIGQWQMNGNTVEP